MVRGSVSWGFDLNIHVQWKKVDDFQDVKSRALTLIYVCTDVYKFNAQTCERWLDG